MLAYDKGDQAVLRVRWGTNVTRLKTNAAAAATTLVVYDITGYANTDTLMVGPGLDTQEIRVVSGSPSGTTITVTAALSHDHHVGETVQELTDPTTVTLKVLDPAGTTTTYTYAGATVTKDSLGVYSKTLDLTLEGRYQYSWEAGGAVVAAERGEFWVRPTEF